MKATIGGFHRPLTGSIEIPLFVVEIPLFFDVPLNPYHSEKIDIADSEYRTPESKFRLFLLTSSEKVEKHETAQTRSESHQDDDLP